jgi:FkbM family methyltransferase
MTVKVKRIIRKIKSFLPVMKGMGNVTFSQFGEDIIMLKMLERYQVKNITYFDIGANDPVNGSNTYNFYLRGYKGVLIEPNESLYKKIKQIRSLDKVLNIGIANSNETLADYYMFGDAHSGMNTFSKEEALSYEKQGFKIEKKVQVPLRDINEILQENFTEPPTVISIDVEGLDEMILQKLDFEKYHPLLICVETVEFDTAGIFNKRKNLMQLLESKGYFVYADTYVNTIFCSKKLFAKLTS